MKTKFSKIFFGAILIMFSLLILDKPVFAAPARNGQVVFMQPSGESFKVTLNGDEKFNWVTSETGEVICRGEDKYWYYAELDSDTLKPSDKKYKIDQKPSNIIKPDKLLQLKENDELNYIKQDSEKRSVRYSDSSNIKKSISLSDALNEESRTDNLLLILVQFNDVLIKNSDSKWSNTFFGESGSTVNNYYKEVSGGRFSFTPAKESYGSKNDGVIKVTLDYNHPSTGDDVNIKDTLAAADPYINFSAYDTNEDGVIESDELHIVTIIAGYEASYSGNGSLSVWAHWTYDDNSSITLDNKVLGNTYTQQGEMHGDHMATIGVLCHELGHDLGLPDLYDYDLSSSGVGVYSLMAGGNWNYKGNDLPGTSPAHLDPLCKIGLGFYNPINVNSSGKYTADSVSTGKYNILKVNTDNPKEYFLVENRQFSGFDSGLSKWCKSGGVAIWHIDETVFENSYTINDDEDHKAVDLEEANEGSLGYSQLDNNIIGFKAYDHFYYSDNNTVFSSSSVPNSNLYDGTITNITIKSNEKSSNSMNLDISLPSDDDVNVTSVKLDTNTLELFAGKSYALKATISPKDATNANLTWDSSASDVVKVDDYGNITALKAGTAVITVTTEDGQFTDTCTVTVKSYTPIKKISLKNRSVTLGINKPYKLEYTISPVNATNQELKWSSNNELIATVDNEGNVTGISKGTAIITVTDGTVSAVCKVDIRTVESISFNKTSISIKSGKNADLKITVNPSNAVNKNVIWKSSDEEIAKVDNKGKVTGIKDGEVTITAVSEENEKITAECKVLVETTPVTGIKLNNKKLTLSTSENYKSAKLTATLAPTNASYKDVSWYTSNENVAVVDENGLVTAISSGKAVITAATKSGNKTDKCEVTVAPVTNIKLNKDKLAMKVGASTILKANVFPKEALVKDVEWKSEDTSKVIVTKYGKIIAVSETNNEPVIVRAYSLENNSIIAECKITVKAIQNEKKVEGIVLTNIKNGVLLVGKTGNIKAALTCEDKSSPTNKNLIWETSNEEIASVDDNGKIAGKVPGKVTITATAADGSNVSQSVEIEIVQPVK